MAVLILALGIGANTAIFSVLHAIVLRALAFPDAGALVVVGKSRQKQEVNTGWHLRAAGTPRRPGRPDGHATDELR